jgi:hypothetical protein
MPTRRDNRAIDRLATDVAGAARLRSFRLGLLLLLSSP